MSTFGRNHTVAIRAAHAEDAGCLFAFIQALADYERLGHEVVGSAAALAEHLEAGHCDALIAEIDSEPVGFALFFETYSTFHTAVCLHLEDLFVIDQARGKGVGAALLRAVAEAATARGCPRLQWNVLDWNESAIRFYEQIGATVLPDWRTCRVAGLDISKLVSRARSS